MPPHRFEVSSHQTSNTLSIFLHFTHAAIPLTLRILTGTSYYIIMSFDFFTRKHRDLNKPIPEFRKNDLRHATIKKSSVDMPNGLIIEMRKQPMTGEDAGSTKKEFYVKEVVPGGLFQKIHGDRIRAGDRIVKINEKEVTLENFASLWDMNDYLKKELKITIHVQRDGLHLEQKNEWDSAEYTSTNKK
ncbi:MAG: hypothetical protein ACI90V_012426 [Bacillariaceae sp.]|jgi:hypothetical protein